MANTKYDPAVIQQFADYLYARARSVLVVCVLAAVIIGAVAGAAVGNMANPLIGILVFALCIIVGVSIGRELGFKFKLAAQLALCQVQTEINTRTLHATEAKAA